MGLVHEGVRAGLAYRRGNHRFSGELHPAVHSVHVVANQMNIPKDTKFEPGTKVLSTNGEAIPGLFAASEVAVTRVYRVPRGAAQVLGALRAFPPVPHPLEPLSAYTKQPCPVFTT